MAPAAPTRYGIVPTETVHYGLAEEADAGFVRVRLRTQPCGEGLMGVEVRLANTGPKVFETYRAEVSARRPSGDIVTPTRAPYDSPCRHVHTSQLAPGEATTSWYVYPTTDPKPDLRVAIDLTEPDGLAIYKTVFHLDEDQVARDADAAAGERPAPPSPHLALVESPYYRVTVVDQRACRDEGHTTVSYEVVLESFTNVPLRLGLSELIDSQGRSYDGASSFRADRCRSSEVALGGPVGDVPPGEKRRGWLYSIVVPADVTSVRLRGSVFGGGLGGSEFTLALGPVPAPAEVHTKPKPVAPAASLSEALAPKAAPPPMFRDLAPALKDAATYEPAKVLTLFKDHHRQHGNFLIGVVPTTTRLWAAGFYPEWTEKRYPLAKMVEQTRDKFVSVSTDKLFARLVLFHNADVMFNSGEHSLKVPDDIAEFIFLELDGQPPIRCSQAEIPLMSLVGPFSKQVAVVLVFELPKGVAARVRSGKGSARFVVGGLGMPRGANHFDYPLPFDALTNDAPVELQRLFQAIDAAL